MTGVRGRIGLRARVTIAFALGALLLSVLLSVLTYELARTYLVGQRQTSAQHQADANARLVEARLQAPLSDVQGLLGSLRNESGSTALLEQDGAWRSSTPSVSQTLLPASVVATVEAGHRTLETISTPSGAQLVAGIPLPSVDARYFEVFSLFELHRTLRTLALTLVAAGGVTTIAGAAVGLWSTRRVLRPVADIARAAADIAGGRLDIRLPANPDADLAVLTQSFNAMVASLQARLERDARFASDVSHELRSPLTTIATSIEVLQRYRDDLDERPRIALDLLSADVGRFQRLVQDLIEMSRTDAGVVDVSLEPVRLAELVSRATSSAGAVPVEIEAGAEDLFVLADKRRLERSIANILENAAHYAGGATLVSVSRAGDRVRVAVADHGPGVPPPAQERIFERFARGPNATRRDGSPGVGLGLALVADHIHLHHGSVWVEDNPGGGARFVIELPVGAVEPSPSLPATLP